MNKAVFIDRDGVINSDEGHYYVYRVEDFVFNPHVKDSLAALKQNGYLLIMITNQGGVAKGEYTEEDIQKVHQFMQNKLMESKANFDAIYYCPHHDSVATCDCRKPKPGMILQAIKDFDIDPKQSFLIGDSKRDIEAGNAAGLKQCFQVPKNTSIYHITKQITDL